MEPRLLLRHTFALFLILALGLATAGRTIAAVNTTTTVTSDSNPSVYGTTVNFTVMVQGALLTAPTGSVTLTDSVNGTLATVSLPTPTAGQIAAGNNSVSVPISVLTAGGHTVTAAYAGDTNDNSSSGMVSQTVNQAGTSLTAFSTAPNPSIAGQAVTFTVKLSVTAPGAGTPTGTINFQDSGTTVASVSISGANTYTATSSTLSVGSRTITAVYTGNTNFQSSSVSTNQTVKSTTSTVIDSITPSAASFGQTVTFHATVTGSAGTPTGTVQFNDGGFSLGPPQTLSNGAASFSTNALSVATHSSITAVYSGDAANGGSASAPATIIVGKDNTTVTTPVSSNGTVTYGQAVTFSVTVSSVYGQTPTGTVTFQDNGVSIGTGTLGAGGSATSPSIALSATPTTHPITAVYNGSGNFNGSASGTFTQTVNKAATNTALSSSADPSAFNQSVTFTATITSGGGTPSGTVQFQIDGANVKADGTPGTQNVALSGNHAALTTSSLALGTHTISAAYSGDSNFSASTGTLSPVQTVSQAATTTTVTSNNNPSAFGQPVTFTATVTGGSGGIPTGTVTFKDGGTTIGTGTLGAGGTPATFTTAALAGGTHTITAVYGGDTNFAGSSGTLSPPQSVNTAATMTTVVSSANPSTFGQPVMFTATVTGTNGIPTGTVTFTDTDGSTIGTGTLSAIGPGTPNAAAATITVSSLSITNLTKNPPNPPHAITAVYNSDGNFAPSSGTLSPAQTVNQAANTIIVTSSSTNSQSVYGQTVTFTASVTGGSAGTPTGTVTFKDGTTSLGDATLDGTGIAKITTSALTAGLHTITAIYNGDTNNASQTSPSLTQTVAQAVTATALTSSNTTPNPGDSITFTATVSNTTVGSSATPSAPGTIQFQLDGVNVKSDGTPGAQPIALSASGLASFTVTPSAGAHQVKASYSGDSNFAASTGSFTQPAGVPTIIRLTPNSELENDPTFTISIDGSGFIQGALVNFNGNAIKADTVSTDGTKITVTVDGRFLAQPGTVSVSVSNPGQTVASNALPFQIKSPNGPSLFSTNPTAVLTGLVSSGGSLVITLKGSNFSTNAQVGYTPASTGTTIVFNKQNANVTFIDSSTLTFTVPGSFLQDNDTATITVRNQDPGGGGLLVSGPVTFTIGQDPTPLINTLNPVGVSVNGTPGTNSFTLNLLGTNFLPGAIVTFTDPQGNATVFGTNNAVVNATGDQVSVTVDNSLVRQAGRYTVQTANVKSVNGQSDPYAGAPLSNTQPFVVSNRQPFVDATKFSPSFAVAGATTAPNVLALTITGSNFDPGATATSQHSTVIFNNTTLSQNSVRVINSTTLIANIDASLLTTAGLANVVVGNIDSDGVTQILSNAVQFPINPVYARGTYPSHGIVLFSVPYDYSGSNPYDVIKEVTFGPNLSAGAQYFGLGTTPGSNVLTDIQDLLSLSVSATAKIAQWSPQNLTYTFASAPPTLDLQLQLGRAYWGVNFPDSTGSLPGAFGLIKLGASATVNPYPVPLTKGWNMVGDPYPTSVSIFGITVQRAGRVYSFTDAVADGFISPVFWSYEGGASYVAHYPGKIDVTSPVKDTLDPFAGYWLLCNTDCQLLVPRP